MHSHNRYSHVGRVAILGIACFVGITSTAIRYVFAQTANSIPVARVSAPSFAVTNTTYGQSVSFIGSGTDSDGSITGYEWRLGSCALGYQIGSTAAMNYSLFSVGPHNVFFRVKDTSGAWSPCVSRSVITAPAATGGALSAQAASQATIVLPTFKVTDVYKGTSITFTGAGSASSGQIAGYEWRDGSCSTGVLLGTSPQLVVSTLSRGTHSIYLRVTDQSHTYSTNCPVRTVNVNNAPVGAVPPPVTPPTPAPTPVVTPVSGKFPSWMKWGVDVGWQANTMPDFEKLTGKQPEMEMVFAHWGNDTFPSEYKTRIADKGRTMVLFWEAVDYNKPYFAQPEYSFDSVIAGNMDAYFTQFAKDAKAYGGPVILAPYSEFNGDWFPWGLTVQGNTPEKYIAAWKHIHSFFVGVPNVQFAWVPNSDSVPNTGANNPDLAYPGDAYVDMIGLDGFNNAPWLTFDQMLGVPLRAMAHHNKPLYILSMGVKDDVRKAAWITDALTVQLYKYPNVKGWMWFNESKAQNWKIDSNPAALKAFIQAIP